MATDFKKIIDELYKKNFPRMVISLAKYAGLQDLATAEDIIQESFVQATVKWEREMPDNPEAWLYRVGRNLAYKKLRDGKLKKTQSLYESEITLQYQVDQLFAEDDEDDQLKMLYSCVHPHFAPKAQVIFALRYVAGFRVEQIAAVLGALPESVTKTLMRMRATITRDKLTFQAGSLRLSSHKTPVVLKVLYLMFSEGYKSSHGKTVLNIELCEDALSLTQAVAASPALACPEAEGLLALILFSLSRFEARFAEDGELVDLENQDRHRWNRDLIRVATLHLGHSRTAAYGTWHLEAAIAYIHSSSPSFEQTDWKKIASIYSLILATNDSPFTRLNQAIAIFYSGEAAKAVRHLDALGGSAIMQQYHLYHVALGKIRLCSGDTVQARKSLDRAIKLTSHPAEQDFIRKLMKRCE